MANTIIVKRSSVAGKVPLPADLQIGELAVNLADQKIYSKNAAGTVIQLGGGAGSGDVVGPASATDNAIPRYDGTTGRVIQNSSVTIDDDGNFGNVNAIAFDTTPATTPTAAGAMFWDAGNGGPSVVLDADVTLQLGQENIVRVYNGSGATIANGSVVAVSGAQGQRPSVVLADADSEPLSAATLGIATENIANGAEGFVTTFGLIRGIDTSAFTAGAPIYLSSTAGAFTATRPVAPAHTVFLGWVIKVNASSGEVFVNISNGWELDELHNVLISSPVSGNTLVYDATAGVWENANLTAGTGINVTNGAGSITITNTAPDQTVALTGAGATTVTGTYPNFTISSVNTTYSLATSTVAGLIELASDTVQSTAANAVTSTASRTYGLQVNASGQGVVNVPWTDTVYTLPAATSTVLGGIELGSDTVQTTAANAVTSTASRTYALQVNAAGQGVVNVPWTDTNSGGTVTSVATGTGLSGGPITTSGTISIANTGVSAGSYTNANITVNAQGQITAASSGAGAFPAGTVMLFRQTAAPTGWTKDTTNFNDSALRVVTGAVSSGGTVGFTTAFASQAVSGSISSTTATNQNTTSSGTIGSTTATNQLYTPAGSVSVSVSGSVGSTTLDTNTLPSHNHLGGSKRIWDAAPGLYGNTGDLGSESGVLARYTGPGPTYRADYSSSTGASWSHNHGFSGSGSGSFSGTAATIAQNAHNHSLTMNAHTHTQDAHTHSFTGTAINMAVKYCDVIFATKD